MSEQETLTHYAVHVIGHDAYPVAMFRYQEHAKEFAQDNYYGNWLMKEVELPLIPFATKEELDEAKKRVETEYGWLKDLVDDGEKVDE